MEAVLYIVMICGGIFLIGWFSEQIGKWNDRRKSKIRDGVAKEVLPQTIVTNELIAYYKAKLTDIGYRKNQEYSPFWKDVLSDGKKSYRGLVGLCPACKQDDLRVVHGRYGKFLGCLSYPKCRYTKNLDEAKSEYKEKSHEEFMKLFNLAYQT